MNNRKNRKTASLVKNKSLLIVTIIIPVIIIAFLSALLVQHEKITSLQEDVVDLKEKLYEEQARNSFYKKAYEVTLDDVMTLSKNYGGEEKYKDKATELRREELGTGYLQPPTYEIKNPEIWKQYVETGFISLECLETIKVDTIQDETLISISVDSAGPLSFYIDSNLITRLQESTIFNIEIPKGLHTVDIVGLEPFTLTELKFDTVQVQIENGTVDLGTAWSINDCINSSQGTTVNQSGALRFLIEKS